MKLEKGTFVTLTALTALVVGFISTVSTSKLLTANSSVTSTAIAGEASAPIEKRKFKTGITEKEIAALFGKWNAALQTGNPDMVAKLYANDAILLPTVSNEVRSSHDRVKDYFEHFLALKPKGSIVMANIRILNDQLAVNSGVYKFDVVKNGKPDSVKCRYTFIYRKVRTEWLIIDHHSSLMPEGDRSNNQT